MNKQPDKSYNRTGQAAILVLIISLMLTALVTTMVAVVFSLTRATTLQGKGERALAIAEAGAENAILRLLRDPGYTGESGLNIAGGVIWISVTGADPGRTVAVGASYEGVERGVTVELVESEGVWEVVSWQGQ